MSETSEALRPCPFCGSGPDRIGPARLAGHVTIQCGDCESSGPWIKGGTIAAVQEAWNRRAALAAPEQGEVELPELLRQLSDLILWCDTDTKEDFREFDDRLAAVAHALGEEVNGPTFMGEPVVVEQGVAVELPALTVEALMLDIDGDDPQADELNEIWLAAMDASDTCMPAYLMGHAEWCGRTQAACKVLIERLPALYARAAVALARREGAE